MKKYFTVIAILFFAIQSRAQNGVAINTVGTAPDASAVLDVSSTTQGMLIPRMTLAERNAIPSPATGLMIYQTTAPAGFYFYNGTAWVTSGALVLNDLADSKTVGQSVFVGDLSGNSTSGANNTGVGYNSLNTLSTGTGNVAVGTGAGSSTTGNDNVLIGRSVLPSATGANSELNIGNAIYGTNLYGANANIGLGNGNNAPDASALLDMSSTTKGLLIPQMTEAERDLITTPAKGLMIYQTDGTEGFYYNSGTSGTPAWVSQGAKAINDLSDGKTVATSDYLGAASGQNATGNFNVAFGQQTMENTTGLFNTGMGFRTLKNTTSGNANTAIGAEALTAVTTGADNIGIGDDAGAGTTTGSSNILIGRSANTTAAATSAELNIGDAIYGTNLYGANANIGLGNGNNAPDASALLDMSSTTKGLLIPRMTEAERDLITTPAKGLMIYQTNGTEGFYYNSGTSGTPAWVSATGAKSINDLSDARTNNTSTFLGSNAGVSSTGAGNTFVGYDAGNAMLAGFSNTFIGRAAGSVATTGNDNIGVGKEVLLGLTTGSNNVMISEGPGNITTGSGNIVIGKFPTAVASSTTDNQMSIGNTIYATGMSTASAKVGVGNINNAPNSTLDVSGSFALAYASGGAVTLDDTHHTYNCNAAASITLPTAVGIEGRVYIIKLTVAGPATVQTTSSQTIDGSVTYALTAQYKYVQVQSDVANWLIIGQN